MCACRGSVLWLARARDGSWVVDDIVAKSSLAPLFLREESEKPPLEKGAVRSAGGF